jgi:vacuolar-type H+-ATPase subunit E/Vma4
MSYGNVEALTEAILAQAQRDRQRIIHEAEGQAQRIIAEAEGEAFSQRAHITEHAEVMAADLEREARGSARMESQAIKVRKREALLDEMFSRAAEQLAEFDRRPDYAEVVEGLVIDAVLQTGLAQPPDPQTAEYRGEQVSLVILADEAAQRILDEATLRRLGEEVGCELALAHEPLPQEPGGPRPLGVEVRSGNGHLRYDNTLQVRLGRMRGALRASTFRILMGEPR